MFKLLVAKNISEYCAICRNKLTAKCLTHCESDVDNKGACDVTCGECEHSFHVHCMDKWLTRHATKCPLDDKKWVSMLTRDTYDPIETTMVQSLLPEQLDPMSLIFKQYIGPYPLTWGGNKPAKGQ